jgi:ribonuclease P protein component
MIAQKHRFHGYSSLRYVYQNGQTVRNPQVSLKFARNARRTVYRAAVIVSRKVQKSAAARNRIRRRLYEVIRSFESDISEPYDIVLSVFSEKIADVPATDLNKDIGELFVKAGILRKSGSQSKPASHAIVKLDEES